MPSVSLLLGAGRTKSLTPRYVGCNIAFMMDHPLKAYRRENGLSLEALAVKALTTRSTLSRVEARLLRPTHDLLRRISDATEGNVSIEALVEATVVPAREVAA